MFLLTSVYDKQSHYVTLITIFFFNWTYSFMFILVLYKQSIKTGPTSLFIICLPFYALWFQSKVWMPFQILPLFFFLIWDQIESILILFFKFIKLMELFCLTNLAKYLKYSMDLKGNWQVWQSHSLYIASIYPCLVMHVCSLLFVAVATFHICMLASYSVRKELASSN